MPLLIRRALIAVVVGLISAAAATAGQSSPAGSPVTRRTIVGPAAPVPPEVVTRDDRGRVTVRAIALREPLRMDGRLDESLYSEKSVNGFFQVLPDNGAPATEDTDVWVSFDRDNVYVSARCWQRSMETTLIANEMRRDRARENDGFGVALDTFYDKQTGFLFYTNPLGSLGDGQVGEAPGVTNADFNPIWDVRTGRFDGGWTVEMRIPFKTLRYPPGERQVWGVQFRRVIRHRTETAFLTKLPITFGSGGIARVSYAATLVGVEVPGGGQRVVEIKPYAIARITKDRVANPPIASDFDRDAGLDVKYGLGGNLAADLTVNTDFAQVEVDDQQVNLTRFNLVFPEKREFFLEGAGIFAFGAGGSTGDTPQVFFSRRIGIEGSSVVPILAGGRVQGKVGRYSVGLIDMQTREGGRQPSTNFSVMRVKRDVLRRSSIGAVFTGRSQSSRVSDAGNTVWGADGNFLFFDNVNVTGYLADSQTRGLEGKTRSHQLTFGYNPDSYGFGVEHLYVGDAFNPEVGFVRRGAMDRTNLSARVSPRPVGNPVVRRYIASASLDYILNTERVLESRNQDASFEIEFQNADRFVVSGTRAFDRPFEPFNLATDVAVVPGDYNFDTVRVLYGLGPQKAVTGNVQVEYGGFYGGERTALNVSSGRIALTARLSIEPSLSVNWVDVPGGAFTTTLSRTRVNYNRSARMSAAAFVQYNSSNRAFSTNARLRWEYRLGSELFVVFTEDRPTDERRGGFGSPLNRAFVVKVNRLFRR